MKYIVANWKMNMNLQDIQSWLTSFGGLIRGKTFDAKIILAAPTPYLFTVNEFAKQYGINCASQDVSVYDKGAHTGESGAFELKDFCTYTIVGHSERKEDLEVVAQKRDKALEHGITPLVCFTHMEQINRLKKPEAILVWEDPANISKNGVYMEKDPKDIDDAFKQMKNDYPDEIILYGGSVNANNISHLKTVNGIEGVLVGNASLDPEHFLKLVGAFS